VNCLLCEHLSEKFYDDFYKCQHCELIFKNPQHFLSNTEEFNRYQFHENDINDSNYVNFLKKLIDPIDEVFTKTTTHLDFGSGKSPVFHHLLKDRILNSSFYDLYFYPNREILNNQYDVVTCSEVVEHFNNPKGAWDELLNSVKRDGYLAIMTSFYHPEIDFNKWYYKNDPTHVAFYQAKTFQFLSKKYNLKTIFNDSKSRIIFQRV
jgi:hypothetical protein